MGIWLSYRLVVEATPRASFLMQKMQKTLITNLALQRALTRKWTSVVPLIVYYQAVLETKQCLLKHWSDVCGNLPTVLLYLRACPFVLVKGVKASAECPACCALAWFGRSPLSWVVSIWKEWGRKLMRRNKYFFWEVRGPVLFETASNIAAWLEYQGKEEKKRKEEGTGNVQCKSCIILPWHFLFLVRFNSRSEGVFSFPCPVENRSIEDVSLKEGSCMGKFWEAASVRRFAEFMLHKGGKRA